MHGEYRPTFRCIRLPKDSDATFIAAAILQQLWFSRLLYTDALTN